MAHILDEFLEVDSSGNIVVKNDFLLDTDAAGNIGQAADKRPDEINAKSIVRVGNDSNLQDDRIHLHDHTSGTPASLAEGDLWYGDEGASYVDGGPTSVLMVDTKRSRGEIVGASAELTLTTAYQDVPGLTKTFTPPQDCYAIVHSKMECRIGAVWTSVNDVYTQLLLGAAPQSLTYVNHTLASERKLIVLLALLTLTGGTPYTVKVQSKKIINQDSLYTGGNGSMLIHLIPQVGL